MKSILVRAYLPLCTPDFFVPSLHLKRGAHGAAPEIMTGPRDLSPITVKYIRASAKKAQLKTRT